MKPEYLVSHDIDKKFVQVKPGSLPRTEAFELLRSEHSDFFGMGAAQKECYLALISNVWNFLFPI